MAAWICARRSRWCRSAICCSASTSWKARLRRRAARPRRRRRRAAPAAGRPRARRRPAEGAGGTASCGRRRRRRTPAAPHRAGSRRRRAAGAPRRPPPPPVAAPRAPRRRRGVRAEVWRRVLAGFEAKRPRLAALLAHAEVVSLSPGDGDAGVREQARRRPAEKARARDRAVASAALGRPTQVTFSVGGGPPAAGASAPRSASETDAAPPIAEAREAEARQHPVIRRAQDVFGAALKEIKTLDVDPRSQGTARDRPADPERGGARARGAGAQDRRGRDGRRPLPLHGERQRRGPVARPSTPPSSATRR